MRAIVKSIKSVWNVCGSTAGGCVNAVKRELGEYKKGWLEAEEYWKENPQYRIEYPMY